MIDSNGLKSHPTRIPSAAAIAAGGALGAIFAALIGLSVAAAVGGLAGLLGAVLRSRRSAGTNVFSARRGIL